MQRKRKREEEARIALYCTPENVYMFCVFISLITSVYFVIIPLNKLRIEYGFSVRDKEKENKKRKIIQFLNGPEQNEKNLRKIRQYLFSEMIVSILPLLAVLAAYGLKSITFLRLKG